MYEIVVCSISTVLSTAIIFVHERAHTLDWDPPLIIRWIATCTFDAASFNWSQKAKRPLHNKISVISDGSGYSNNEKMNQKKIEIDTNGEFIFAKSCDPNEISEILGNLRKIVSKTNESFCPKEIREKKCSIWTRAFDRIDFLLLIVLLLSNTALTFVMLV